MAVVRWDPFRDLETLQSRMNRVFSDALLRARGTEEGLLEGAWRPAVDIFEDEGNFVVKAEVPEIDPQNIDIRVEENVLTLKGERKVAREEKKENYHLMERSYGAFQRSFTLPASIDRERIKAAYDKGVLTITLPKREEQKPKQVKIEVK
jgi:HSP20 family protein